VRIDAVGWNGTDGAAGSALSGLFATSYQNIIDSMKADGFNTIRIPWSDVSLNAVPAQGEIDYSQNPDLQGLTTLQIYQKVVAYAGQIGMKVIFDHHTDDGGANGWGGQQANGLWFDSGPGSNGTDGDGHAGTVTAAQFEQDTLTLAKTFSGNSTVVGFDLDNEPTPGPSGTNGINWGQGGPDDIQAMYTSVGNAVEAADPGALIIAEGILEYSDPPSGSGLNTGVVAPEGDLTGVATDPVTLNVPDKVVYSVHEYPNEIGDIDGVTSDTGAEAIDRMNADWGYLISQNIAPVWVGEMGADMTSTDAKNWAATLIPYLNGQDGAEGGPTFSGDQQPISTDWWLAGDQAGDIPDGTQSAWGPPGNYRPEVQAITDQLVYVPHTPDAPASGPAPADPASPAPGPSANDTAVTGTASAIIDASGNQWTITSFGQVAVNGTADPTTANVIELAYVNGAIWQENASDLWWSKTQPDQAWSEPGTATSPLPARPAASANDTVVTGTAAAITDVNGNLWTITAGGQVAVNGTADPTTADVIELAYVSGRVWQENTSDLWWAKSLPTDSWGPALGTSISPLTPPMAASANNTVVTTAGPAIEDAGGNAWSITSGGQVAVNGVADSTTANVTELAYENGLVWQQNSAGLWWSKSAPADAWGPALGTSTSPLPTAATPSSNDSIVTTAGPALVDAGGNDWTISAADTVFENGQAAGLSADVRQLASVNGSVWQENTSGLWWQWNGTSWPGMGSAASPLAEIVAVNAATFNTATVDAMVIAAQAAEGATFNVTDPGVASLVLGSTATSIQFIDMDAVNVTGGSAAATVTADTGTATFIAGSGAMNISGGSGADTYVLHAGSGNLTIADFSAAKGDTLTIDQSLQGAETVGSDGAGGVLLSFGTEAGWIDLKNTSVLPQGAIHFS
jgi:aryl-phospho-beta-D-glucosidase BglC (GH1 family)